MVIVMDMGTGEIEKFSAEETAADEFGAFVDEVLNAGWLPQPESGPAARLEVHTHTTKSSASVVEPDEFLRNLYRYQE
jgi:hypothetical protein